MLFHYLRHSSPASGLTAPAPSTCLVADDSQVEGIRDIWEIGFPCAAIQWLDMSGRMRDDPLFN